MFMTAYQYVLQMLFVSFVLPAPAFNAREMQVKLPPAQQEGLASFYGAGEKGMHGRITASGEEFDPEDHTCASRNLPINSIVIVEDVRTGNWTYCRVNDRGPYGAKLYERAGGGWGAMFRKAGKYVVKRRENGLWLPSETFSRRPGRYRGVMDMSYGTAKALGVDLDSGLNRVRIRFWNDHAPMSPQLAEATPLVNSCSSTSPACF